MSEVINIKELNERIERESVFVDTLRNEMGKVIVGQSHLVDTLLIGLLSNGHILLEGVPGLAKTLAITTLAKAVDACFSRIQFTPDLLPADLIGTLIYSQKKEEFAVRKGPIFANFILADEINRTTPRTQSSLLECMSESVVTIDGKGHVLPKPFFVVATQNPEDYHGTYPLPEPQLDRFLMRLSIGYPSPEAEMEILNSQQGSHPLSRISYVIRGSDIIHCHALVRKVTVADSIKEYIIRIVDATRSHHALTNGCSPRAALALMRCCQSLAAYYGRNYVTPRDVRMMVKVVLAHRMRLRLRYQGEFHRVETVLDSILDAIPMANEEPGA